MTRTLIDRNPDILDGTLVSADTSIPVRISRERLKAGDRLDDFRIPTPGGDAAGTGDDPADIGQR